MPHFKWPERGRLRPYFRSLLVLAPLLGEQAAEVLTVFLLLILVYLITAMLLGRVGLRYRLADLWVLGFLWMVLTIAFELIVFGVFMPISELLEAYNGFAGEFWIVIVVGVLLAPRLVHAGRRLRRRQA